MNKMFFKCLLLMSTLVFLLPTGFLDGQTQEETKSFTLENGLKIYLFEKHNLPLVNMVFAFDVGSKDETEETSGLVHILEHYILFRGTEARTGAEISQDIRRHGAYFNAHTGRDLSLFELTLPSEYIDFGLSNQKEILFTLKLTQENLDKEKEVILEEISNTEDDPDRYPLTLLFNSLYGDHPYHRPIYGRREVISGATVEQLEAFYHKYFIPSNASLAVVGDFSITEMESKLRQTFSDIPAGEKAAATYPMVEQIKKKVEITHTMDTNKAYMVIGALGPDYNNTDQYTLDVLSLILGGGINPMLNSVLRGQRRLVDSVRMGFGAERYGGAITVLMTLEKKSIKSAQRTAVDFLKSTRSLNYSLADYQGDQRLYATDFMENAKNQIRFSYYQSQENGLNIAASLARYMLMNTLPDRGKYLDMINAINPSDLRKAAAEYLSKGRFAIISILPQTKKQEKTP
jgi:zinc protease